MKRRVEIVFALLVAAAGCQKNEPVTGQKPDKPDKPEKQEPAAATPAAGGAENIDIQGAGATFPYPLYSKWVAEYQKVDPHVRINYQSIGSGGGIKQITEQTVDFGASDAPMKDDELAKAPGTLVHIPTTLGAVVISYNLPAVKTPLKLSRAAQAGIFLGEITKWNDPKIAAQNPDVKLPGDDIQVAFRSDGSGTTAVFTSYLAKISPAWKEKVGEGKSVKFPVGNGAKGNEGVAGQIKTTPGTVGYVEVAYAKQTGLAYAQLENAAGKYVEPTLDAITTAAAAAAAGMPEDLRVSIIDQPGDGSYPIASYTFILVYQDAKDAAKAKAVAKFLWWATHDDGQKLGPDLNYAKLPDAMVKRVEAKLKGLKAGAQALL
jgi:phosphate transport system substrate-binding protein